MSLTEGDRVTFDGPATDDGPTPGAPGTILAIMGTGVFIQLDSCTSADQMHLVHIDYLTPIDEPQGATP